MHTQRQLNMWHKWCHNSTVKDSFYGQTLLLPISKRENKTFTSYNIQNQSWLQDCHVRREEFQWNGWDGSQIAWGQEGIGGEQWDLSLECDTVNTPISCDTHTHPNSGTHSPNLQALGFISHLMEAISLTCTKVQGNNHDGGVGRPTAPPRTTRTDRESNGKGVQHQGNKK